MIDTQYFIDKYEQKIHNKKSKAYFKEVIQTFYSGAYRSCMVSLYSVVICDLVFKLEELVEIYDDESAYKILKDIRQTQTDKPKNPEWENEILQLIMTRTQIFEVYEAEHINQLKSVRHLCAHPVLSSESILYTPNRETAISHIVNMLNHVLTKAPNLNLKTAERIVIELANNKNSLFLGDDLERFLNYKYLARANKSFVKKLYKILWKLIFKVDNVESNSNRDINFLALKVIISKYKNAIIQFHEEENDYFDFDNNTSAIYMYLSLLLFYNPFIYTNLSAIVQQKITFICNKDTEFKLLSFYRFDDFLEYKDMVFEMSEKIGSYSYSPNHLNITYLQTIFKNHSHMKEYLSYTIFVFKNSSNYDEADIRFTNFITPNLSGYSISHVKELMNAIEENGQILNRRRAKEDHLKVKESILLLDPTFNFNDFPSFIVSIR